jgi:flagellar motor switch protein FliN/FliY
LSQGSIIELDKLAGEPVDILVNNKLIAKGEVVVIDENFGVRVTDIISQWDRIQKLQ